MAEKIRSADIEAWDPKTDIGKKVKSGEITTLEEIKKSGKPVLEPEIIDKLYPDLESETLQVKTTQRVTDSGKRVKFRVVKVIGDKKGHVGLGVGKCDEIKPAMEYAVNHAKKNMISVKFGCGSWEYQGNLKQSLPFRVIGKEGSTVVTLMPAPPGIGLASNDVVKKVLKMAGIKDVWSTMHGGSNTYNIASATMKALDSLNTFKGAEQR
ncbi:30S ribosomal protein S5 [Candidatus Micrarchaeota archaeon]|nr:30S ribosomal protein S5 [Candidatus Micrarchaeota archaeon]